MIKTMTASEFDSFREQHRVADGYDLRGFHWFAERDGRLAFVDVREVERHKRGHQDDITVVVADSNDEGERELLELLERRKER